MTDFLYLYLTVWGYSAVVMSQVVLLMFAVAHEEAECKIPLASLNVLYLIAIFKMTVLLPYYAYTESFESLNKKYKKIYANYSNKLKDL